MRGDPSLQRAWLRHMALPVATGALLLSGCVMETGPGPYAKRLANPTTTLTDNHIRVVDVNEQTARLLTSQDEVTSFANDFPDSAPSGTLAGMGDLLAITVWEAPPAALFAGTSTIGLLPANAPASGIQLPEQTVSNRGYVTVPYAGEIRAAGRSGPDIAHEIVRRLTGKANQPQAIVRIVKNSTATVTVVGDVANSTRMPLSAQGERLLDAIASAGGVKQAVGKMTVQLTRGDRVRTMPLSRVINDPRQNVMLLPRDVVTALYQPFSYTVLGATGRNEEVNFEATGLSLGQAIGRAGGLVDNRANAHGVFVFRYEDPALLPPAPGETAPAQGPLLGGLKVPVIFRIDLKDPGAYFVAQNFAIRNKDILYVSNARYVDVQRFSQLIGSLLSPAATAASLGRNF